MNRDINQDNIHLILPSKISWMADMLVEDKGISIVEAMRQIYSSNIYQELENEETKMWHLGPVALYQMLEETPNY